MPYTEDPYTGVILDEDGEPVPQDLLSGSEDGEGWSFDQDPEV